MCGLYAKTMPFYIRELSIFRFWYPIGVLESILHGHLGTAVSHFYYHSRIIRLEDFPGGSVVKNPPASAGDTGSSPGPGRSHTPWSN